MFEATLESLQAHAVPQWYQDAKFGIFVHWGLYSVPAFAPHQDKDVIAAQAEHGFESIKSSSYAEWYLNSMKFRDYPTWQYHTSKYGENTPYTDFQTTFELESARMDPGQWADLFKKAGARYAVMVTKHHDGYVMWPTRNENPLKPGYFSRRDLVGEVTDAVTDRGLRMGFYYSGVFDWTFIEEPIGSHLSFIRNFDQGKQYAEYAKRHFLELIDRYRPSILWNDIGAPYDLDVREIQAYFYNAIEEGVINDRWRQLRVPRDQQRLKALELALSGAGEGATQALRDLVKERFHKDFKTPEYRTYSNIQEKKWESTRGIGHSFGYNHVETPDDMLSSEELIHMLVDVVSKNGNLLLNVGPMADGTIPEMQQQPLLELGSWLGVGGEAIYGTRPWCRAEGKTSDGQEVRFTVKDDSLYATILGEIRSSESILTGLELQENTRIQILGIDAAATWKQRDGEVTISVPPGKPETVASTFKMTPAGGIRAI
jgi:alpha-L-fucosidase